MPVALHLSPGQAADKREAFALVDSLPPAQALVGDRGYDSRALLARVAERGGAGHFPTQRNVRIQRSVPQPLYKMRNLVERYFCKIKHFRRIATRFDKLARNFLAAVALASIRLWTRHYESTT